MDEFGETPTFYIWPTDHELGTPLPEDFHTRLHTVLNAAGFEAETI